MKFKIYGASIMLLSFSFAAIASPTVTKATADVSSIKISGSNFGTENPMVFWDDVTTHLKESAIESGDIIPTGTTMKWGQNTNIYGEPVTLLETTETKSAKKDLVYFGQGHKNFLGDPNYVKTSSMNYTLYVSWWYKPSMSPSAEGGSNKFIRIWDDKGGLGTRISWTQMHLTCGDKTVWGTWPGTPGKWHHHEFFVDLTQKLVYSKVDGKIVHKMTDCTKSPSHVNIPLYIQLIGFDHGGSSYQGMETTLDDFYVAKNLGRVVVSSSPTWKEDMETEVLPIISWSDTEIETVLLRGKTKLSSSSSYFYVVDKDGNVNTSGVLLDCKACPGKAAPPPAP